MEMTRKGFIAALLGLPVIGPLIAKVRKPELPPLTISAAVDHLPFPLKAGEKLAVTFTGSGAAYLCIQADDKIYNFDRGIPERGDSQFMYIAERDLEIRDIRIASTTPGEIRFGKQIIRLGPNSIKL